MNTFFNLLFLLSLGSMVIVYPMYFFSLSDFGKAILRDHPSLLGLGGANLNESYRLLQSVKAGQLSGVPLSAEALAAYSRAKRLLYVGATLFLIVLFIGLTDSLLSKHAG